MNPIEIKEHALWATKVLRPDRAGAFRRDDARNLLRRTLHAYVARHRLRIHAWSVQPSRVHIVLALPMERSVASLLGDLFGYYSRRFNARYGKKGALFRTKFLRRLLIGPLAIHDAIGRVHGAPAESDVEVRPGQEAWSSRDCYEGGVHDGVVTLYEPSGAIIRTPEPGRLDA